MRKPICKTCSYWQVIKIPRGTCHKAYPTTIGNKDRGIFPVTLDSEWCGEHPKFDEWLAQEHQCTIDGKLVSGWFFQCDTCSKTQTLEQQPSPTAFVCSYCGSRFWSVKPITDDKSGSFDKENEEHNNGYV